MNNITIADIMIALGQMQKDIDKHQADSSYWFNQYCKAEKELNELKEPKEGCHYSLADAMKKCKFRDTEGGVNNDNNQ